MVEDQTPEALDGIKIVELTRDPAGEFVGKLLAGFHADVLKVELPEGSPGRHVGPFVGREEDVDRSLNFWYYNTNKRSAVLEYRTAEGRKLLEDLLDSTDVLISGIVPQELSDLGLDLQALEAEFPRLIILSMTPYGLTGPWKDWASSDLVALALGSPLNSCGYDDHSIPPIRPGGGQSYHTAASFGLLGVLLALLERQTSGRGQLIDVGMHDCLAVSSELANLFWFYPGVEVQRQTCRAAQPTPTQPCLFRCADDRWVYLATFAAEQKGWVTLLEWLESKDLAVDLSDPKWQEASYRQENFYHVYEILTVFLQLQTAEEAYHEGQARGVAIGPLNSPEDLFNDEHLIARGLFVPVEDDQVAGSVIYPRLPYKFSDIELAPLSRPPRLGEHTEALIRSIKS
ncbi:MAG TPA: CoA transferase [Acidimicrobiales bacterium]|jgi:crotonobetainyl-CoA:carnitine CoA-transferase CaiB-like acyl-CoA transferase|nr:CoA transferase [Acidimicrobiales bacterium]